MELTARQRQVFELLTKEGLSVTKVAQRLKLSQPTISKIKKALEKKGVSLASSTGNEPPMHSSIPLNKPIVSDLYKSLRLHGLEFNVKLLSFPDRMTKKFALDNGKVVSILGNTIRIYHKSIEIYVNRDFIGTDVNEITDESYKYLLSLLQRIESYYGIILLKDRYTNITQVKGHIAEMENELAKEYHLEKKLLQVRGDDGKIWLETDFSNKVPELEFIHPKEFKPDCEKLTSFFNDYRNDPEHYVLSDLKNYIANLYKSHKLTLDNQNEMMQGFSLFMSLITETLKPHGHSAPDEPLEPASYIL